MLELRTVQAPSGRGCAVWAEISSDNRDRPTSVRMQAGRNVQHAELNPPPTAKIIGPPEAINRLLRKQILFQAKLHDRDNAVWIEAGGITPKVEVLACYFGGRVQA